MSVFPLKLALNAQNNPSSVFKYGCINIDNPNMPLGFVLFDTYGYTDGTTTPSSPPYDSSKILGWHKSGAGDIHCAIAFENLGTLLNPHGQISPQPFPDTGIYMHPAKLGIETVGTRNPVVRITAPFNGVFSLSGSIQRATINCGSDIGYTIKKNQSVDLQSRAIISTSNTPTAVNIGPFPLLQGDYVDIMIDAGDDGDDACDDTAVDFTVTFEADTVAKPSLVTSTPTCNSTSLAYAIQLQQDGFVELYKVGVGSPIATQNIVPNGVDGLATFNGLSLSTGGTYYTIAKNSGQGDSVQSDNLVIEPCVSQQACNQAFSFYKVKNNCLTGVPTAVLYTVEAGTYCSDTATVEELNWLAYTSEQANAQNHANQEGLCIVGSGANPCIKDYGVGMLEVWGQPGSTAKVYRASDELVLFEMVIPASGQLIINHEFLIGEIYVTLTGLDNIESAKGCMPIVLKEKSSCCKKKKCNCE